jgi:hypothetical protein
MVLAASPASRLRRKRIPNLAACRSALTRPIASTARITVATSVFTPLAFALRFRHGRCPGQRVQRDALPGGGGTAIDFCQHLTRPVAQGSEAGVPLVEFGQVRMGGELRIENRFRRQFPGVALPELDKALESHRTAPAFGIPVFPWRNTGCASDQGVAWGRAGKNGKPTISTNFARRLYPTLNQ